MFCFVEVSGSRLIEVIGDICMSLMCVSLIFYLYFSFVNSKTKSPRSQKEPVKCFISYITAVIWTWFLYNIYFEERNLVAVFVLRFC